MGYDETPTSWRIDGVQHASEPSPVCRHGDAPDGDPDRLDADAGRLDDEGRSGSTPRLPGRRETREGVDRGDRDGRRDGDDRDGRDGRNDRTGRHDRPHDGP